MLGFGGGRFWTGLGMGMGMKGTPRGWGYWLDVGCALDVISCHVISRHGGEIEQGKVDTFRRSNGSWYLGSMLR